MARYTPFRTVISLASVLGWYLHKMNIKTTFLNGEPDGSLKYDKESQLKKVFVWFLYKYPEFGMTDLMAFCKVCF